MGAWGTGIFENDTALDFVAEVIGTSDLSLVSKTLEDIIDNVKLGIDADSAQHGLVAGEIVAALRGYRGDLPEDLETWIATTVAEIRITETLKIWALSVVSWVRDKSELQELWQETDEFETWKASVEDLWQRLIHHRLGPNWAREKRHTEPVLLYSICVFCKQRMREDQVARVTVSIRGQKSFATSAHISCAEKYLVPRWTVDAGANDQAQESDTP